MTRVVSTGRRPWGRPPILSALDPRYYGGHSREPRSRKEAWEQLGDLPADRVQEGLDEVFAPSEHTRREIVRAFEQARQRQIKEQGS